MKTPFPTALAACTAFAVAAAVAFVPAAPARAEGSYTLTKVTFQGNSQVPSSDIQAALPIGVGQSIDKDGVQQDMDAIQALYQKRNVGANISARFATIGKKAQITWIFAEQAPVAPTVVHVGITADHVTVTGNSKIKTADILAAAAIKPGDTLTNEKIQAAQAAVLALYKKANIGVSVNTDWTKTTPQHVDLVFKVVESSDS